MPGSQVDGRSLGILMRRHPTPKWVNASVAVPSYRMELVALQMWGVV